MGQVFWFGNMEVTGVFLEGGWGNHGGAGNLLKEKGNHRQRISYG